MENSATGRIRIKKVPAGEAPLVIREVWVGLILPCFPFIGYINGEVFEVVSGEEIQNVGRGVSVPQDQALDVLERSNPSAASWWRTLGFPQPNQYFFFTEDEIEILSGVSEAPMRVFDDMDTGHWEEMPLGAGGR